MFELELVCKKGNTVIKKAIVNKGYLLEKIKDYLTIEVCNKSIEYANKRDDFYLYIRRDGAYVEIKEKDKCMTYIYSILKNGRYIECNNDGLM